MLDFYKFLSLVHVFSALTIHLIAFVTQSFRTSAMKVGRVLMVGHQLSHFSNFSKSECSLFIVALQCLQPKTFRICGRFDAGD